MAFRRKCSCGHRQELAVEMAGKTARCAACGKEFTVPAIGVLAPRAPTTRAATPGADFRGVLVAGIAAVLCLAGLAGYLLWSSSRPVGPSIAAAPIPIEEEVAPVSRRSVEPEPPPMPENEEPPETIMVAPTPVPKENVKPFVPEPEPKEVVKPLPLPEAKPTEEPKRPVIGMEPRLKIGGGFEQDLTVTQKPTFRVQGVAVNSVLQYRIVSKFTVRKMESDGTLIVQQKVTEAKILQADDTTRLMIAGPVATLPGKEFTLHLNPKLEVVKFEGEGGKPLAGNFGGGQAIQLTSLLDDDGWKEMAQATFFQLSLPIAQRKWSRPLSHGWGPLGQWNGHVDYAYAGMEKDLHKITYAMRLTHQAPAAGKGTLPFAIVNPKFQARQAVGQILYDPALGRVVSAEETFRVAGTMRINLLGQNTPVEVEEDQHFLIKIR